MRPDISNYAICIQTVNKRGDLVGLHNNTHKSTQRNINVQLIV